MVRIRNTFLCGLGVIVAGQSSAAIVLWLGGPLSAAAICAAIGFVASGAVIAYWLRLSKELSGIASSLNMSGGELVDKAKYSVLSAFAAAVNKSLNVCRDSISALNRQVGDLNIQI
ncbi:MAG: hypothetical protein Q7T18_02965, partial [Sedimentisphaerales bacterium]|nr:hypothetical protein [Sedimentisphaerales bacterium]